MSAPRPSRPGEEAELIKLWKAVFGDDGEFLEVFFRDVYRPGMAAVIEEDGLLVSAAYAVPFGEAVYIYAVATLPAYRGRGYGQAVTMAAAGGKHAYLCPAEPSLHRWYREAMGAQSADRRWECSLPDDVRRISSAEFFEARERILANTNHAGYSPALLALFALDGGFYKGSGSTYFAAGSDGRVFEKLPPDEGGEVYLLGLNGAPPIHWGITLE